MRSIALDEARGPGGAVEDHRDRRRRELALSDVAELLEVVVGQDRVRHLEPLRLRRTLLEEVAAGAEGGDQRHHRLFADRVDGRVGHLGEELLEVVEEGQRPLAEHRQRGVVPHRPDGLLAGLPHRRDAASATSSTL